MTDVGHLLITTQPPSRGRGKNLGRGKECKLIELLIRLVAVIFQFITVGVGDVESGLAAAAVDLDG